MNGINDSWNAYKEKIKDLNQQLNQLHSQLEMVKSFTDYIKIRKDIDKLNRHLEVVETLTKDRISDETKRKLTKEYAVYS